MTASSVTYCPYLLVVSVFLCFSLPVLVSCFSLFFARSHSFSYTHRFSFPVVTSILRFFTISVVKSSPLRILFSLSSTAFTRRFLPINSCIPVHLLLPLLDLLSPTRLPPGITSSCFPRSVASPYIKRPPHIRRSFSENFPDIFCFFPSKNVPKSHWI